MDSVRSQGDGPRLHSAPELEDGAPFGVLHHLAVLPLQAGGRAECLCEGFLGGEARSQGSQRQGALGRGEQPSTQCRRTVERLTEPRHVDDVDPDSYDHGVSLSLTRLVAG